MSTFTCHCRATIMRILKSGNGCKLLTVDNHSRFLSYKVKSCGQSVRRIISSEVVGCHLLGYLKVTNFRLIVYVLLSCFIFSLGSVLFGCIQFVIAMVLLVWEVVPFYVLKL